MYINTPPEPSSNQAIAELVLDGVLEIECDGKFVSGSEAYELIFKKAHAITSVPLGTIAQLSISALKYAQALEIYDVTKLSARMYFYHRIPASPYWKRKFPTPVAVTEYLEIQTGGTNRSLLTQNWQPVSLTPPYDGWMMWRSRHAQPIEHHSKAIHKLYVSPACESVREAFQVTLAVLSALRTPCFKIGKDVYGLTRPDKIVAYFWSQEELEEAANDIRHQLAGVPAHGVPFTAEITGDGLLSWGIDPPQAQQTFSWQGPESWRLWITNRLATALIAAKASQADQIEPWRFALERLSLEGVDTETWTPSKTIWNADAITKG